MNKLVCPKCGANHNCLRLWAPVDSEIYLGENGETGPLDTIGVGVNEIRENIVDENMYVHCNICKEAFPAVFNDEGLITIQKEDD